MSDKLTQGVGARAGSSVGPPIPKQNVALNDAGDALKSLSKTLHLLGELTHEFGVDPEETTNFLQDSLNELNIVINIIAEETSIDVLELKSDPELEDVHKAIVDIGAAVSNLGSYFGNQEVVPYTIKDDRGVVIETINVPKYINNAVTHCQGSRECLATRLPPGYA